MSVCGYARLFVLFILHGSFILHLGAYLYYAGPLFHILGCNQHLMAEDKIRNGVLWKEDNFDNGESRHVRSTRALNLLLASLNRLHCNISGFPTHH